MSYDLMVFDPAVAPRGRAAFVDWYHVQVEWVEGHAYDDPAVTTSGLREFYGKIRLIYPNMNGPDAADDDHLDQAADYSIGKHVIYATFPWALAEEVYPIVRDLAVECEVGFYDVSGDEGDGEIHFPGDALRPPSGGAWRDVAAQFRQLKDGN